jgi:hypothetical protein
LTGRVVRPSGGRRAGGVGERCLGRRWLGADAAARGVKRQGMTSERGSARWRCGVISLRGAAVLHRVRPWWVRGAAGQL